MSTVIVEVRRSLTRTIALVQARGPAGKDGSNGTGSQILYGAGVPEAFVGANEDTYVNTTNGDFYRKELGEWLPRANMQGPKGWSPIFGAVTNGNKRVFKLIDYVGGAGTKPPLQSGGQDQYVGAAGLTTDVASAQDMLGPWGWSPVYAAVVDGARRVLQLTDYVGGTATKPSVLSGGNPQYLGPAGLTTVLADATDFRGATGLQGIQGIQGIQGAHGGGIAMQFVVSTITTDADPGVGVVRFNNATMSSATQLFIDTTDRQNNVVSALINTFDDSSSTIKGQLRLVAETDPSKFMVFNISGSVTAATGYHKLTVAHVGSSGSTPFPEGQPIVVTFTPTGDQGIQGVQGNHGGGSTLVYTVSTTTTDADPGTGFLRFNSAVQTGTTSIFIDANDYYAVPATNIIDTWDDSSSAVKGQIQITSVSNPGIFMIFNVSAVVTATGYRKLTVALVGSTTSTPFANNTIVSVSFSRVGDKGDQGIQGIQGVQGNDGWEPVLANEVDGSRVVQKIVDWIGGAGTKPSIPSPAYIGSTGFVVLASATDIRGATGAQGIQGIQGPVGNADTDRFIGMGFPYAGDGDTPPSGFLLANGANVSRTTYSLLFGKIGTRWGTGDGSTTFTLPDWRGRVLIGRDRGTNRTHTYLTNAVGSVGGSQYLQSHTHTGSGNTGTVSADHSHAWSGTTSWDPGHQHYMSYAPTKVSTSTANADRVGGSVSGYDALTHSGGAHNHTVSGQTGGISTNHTHAYSFTTSDHSVTAGSAGNIPPAAVVDWMIFAGV